MLRVSPWFMWCSWFVCVIMISLCVSNICVRNSILRVLITTCASLSLCILPLFNVFFYNSSVSIIVSIYVHGLCVCFHIARAVLSMYPWFRVWPFCAIESTMSCAFVCSSTIFCLCPRFLVWVYIFCVLSCYPQRKRTHHFECMCLSLVSCVRVLNISPVLRPLSPRPPWAENAPANLQTGVSTAFPAKVFLDLPRQGSSEKKKTPYIFETTKSTRVVERLAFICTEPQPLLYLNPFRTAVPDLGTNQSNSK